MLHRSFKPAKCKTSLKLAASRLKLLKNKKEVQLKQMKRELAQLLESGKDQTARIRVEHVVREEKAIAAYDLLEIYCEIIAARLPVIESQKNCPIDLKEAITSVIFAAPRCADITEFGDVKKHFTAKYGKEFAIAATELRPDSGVSRMLVEKLSVKAPDGETKLKILTAIAEEHNIKWDPASFGAQESKPRDDLLNGPSTFENASKTHIEPPPVQTGPSHIQVPPSPGPKYSNTPASFKQNARQSSNLQNFSSGDVSSGPTTTEPASYPGTRPSGSGSERMDATHSHSRVDNAYSAGRHNWNMEFKDATAAAEAAAEAAERASMAARAAAELSGRGQFTTEYSTESPRFKRDSTRNDRPSERVGSKSGKQVSRHSRQDTVHDKDPEINSDLVDRNEHVKQEGLPERFHQESRNSIKKSGLASLRPTSGSYDDDKQKKQQEAEVIEVKKNNVFSEVNTSNKYRKPDVDSQSEDEEDNLHYDDFNHSGEGRMEEKASDVTSQSHSSNRDHVYGISHSSHRMPSIDASENLFPSFDHDTTHGDTLASSSYSDPPVVFDDPLSDDDDFVPEIRSGYDAVEDTPPSSSHNAVHNDAVTRTSSSSNAAVAFDESDSDDDALGFSSRPVFDEILAETDVLPVTFDGFGGSSSGSEDEIVKPGSGELNHNRSRKEQVDVFADSDERVEFGFESSVKFDSDDVPSDQSPSRHSKTSLSPNSMATDNFNDPESPGTMNDDSTESNSGFKFGNLRGGRRNRDTPYTIYPPVAATATSASSRLPKDSAATPSSAIGARSSSNIEVIAEVEQKPVSKTTTRLTNVDRADTDDRSEQSPVGSGRAGGAFSRRTKATPGLVVQSSLNARPKKFSSPPLVTGSDSDSSEEEMAEKHFNRKRQTSLPKSSQQSNAEPQSEGPFRYFDTDDALEHTSPVSGRSGNVPSRRTKASPTSGTKPYTKARVSDDFEPKPSSSSYGSETPSKPESQKVKPARQGSSVEQSIKPAPGNNMNVKPPAMEQTSNPRNSAASGSSVSLKPSSSSYGSETPSKPETQKIKPARRSSSVEQSTKPALGNNVNVKPTAMERTSSPRKSASSGNSVSSKPSTSSGNDPPRDDPPKKPSHVHPKLPDYDLLAARFQSLRENRQ